MAVVKEEGLVVFNSTHDSIKADDLCLAKNIDASLIPTHPSIALGCGFMLRTKWDNFSTVLSMLKEEQVPYKAIYYSKKVGIKREVEKLENFDITKDGE